MPGPFWDGLPSASVDRRLTADRCAPAPSQSAVVIETPRGRGRSSTTGEDGPVTAQQAQATTRYQAIAGWLADEGRVEVVDLATRLGVAQETIRRDLRTMESAGKLVRVHAPRPGPLAVPGLERQNRDRTRPADLGPAAPGRYCAARHRPADARARPHHRRRTPAATGLTIVTNSLDAAVVLSRASRLEIYNIGGTVSPTTRAQEGDWAVVEMERLHVDVSLVCPAGISVKRGLTPAAAAVSQVDLLAVAGRPAPLLLQPFIDRGISVTTEGVRSA